MAWATRFSSSVPAPKTLVPYPPPATMQASQVTSMTGPDQARVPVTSAGSSKSQPLLRPWAATMAAALASSTSMTSAEIGR